MKSMKVESERRHVSQSVKKLDILEEIIEKKPFWEEFDKYFDPGRNVSTCEETNSYPLYIKIL